MGGVRTRADIPRYAGLVLRGMLRTDELMTSAHPLTGVNEAMAAARSRRGVRAMIRF